MKSILNHFWKILMILSIAGVSNAGDTLVFEAKDGDDSAKHIVLISGDEEYRTEESMPMLGKILSQKHGFKCTILFSFGPDGADYIDSNNQSGIRGWEALASADLMIIGTRFRRPSAEDAVHITNFLNAGKPVIGIRTATHSFTGAGDFGGIKYGEFGRKILGEQWVSHHGGHKRQGAHSVVEDASAKHPVLNGVNEIFAPSDVYEVKHLTDADQILMRAAVTETLHPDSEAIDGEKNDPMQAFVWLHTYTTPDGKDKGHSLCTTSGASVDLVSEDLRRLIVNGAYHLTGREVPKEADVDYVDPFYPSFYGFIKEKGYWANLNRKPEDFGLGKTPHAPDPKGSPEWNFRPTPESK